MAQCTFCCMHVQESGDSTGKWSEQDTQTKLTKPQKWYTSTRTYLWNGASTCKELSVELLCRRLRRSSLLARTAVKWLSSRSTLLRCFSAIIRAWLLMHTTKLCWSNQDCSSASNPGSLGQADCDVSETLPGYIKINAISNTLHHLFYLMYIFLKAWYLLKALR